MQERGKFIVIEGIDGSGKSSHARTLTEQITEYRAGRGLPSCLYEREPSEDDPAGRLVRASLTKQIQLQPETLAYLNVASRIEHVHRLGELLNAGHCVVCDRFYPSNMAYNQTPSLSFSDIYDLNRVCLDALRPDAIVFMSISVEESKRRRQADTSRSAEELFETDAIQTAVHDRFLKVFDFLRDKETVLFVDAEADFDTVQERLWNAVRPVLE